ncbi:MAG: ATP-binding protein [Lachnospiraceae bacterium]|jgi:anti-sigma regulatory factor (Ser/Thr protein kinase)|nr:ATP-binding protein [Lachnospiraceae bacterium]
MPDQTMNSHTFILEAVPENFAAAQEQVRAFLAPCSCSMRTLLELDMLVEEIFINIASYAYPDKRGTAAIDLALNDKKDAITITFRDSGIPYNPLEKPSPDLSSPASARQIGGLGIFLVQKYADQLSYVYEDGENRLSLRKVLS